MASEYHDLLSQDSLEAFAEARSHFDEQFYLTEYQDVKSKGIDPFDHYLEWGWREGRRPSAEFDPVYYAQKYLGDADADVIPFLHFALIGKRKGYYPNISQERNLKSPYYSAVGVTVYSKVADHFDLNFYRNEYSDVRDAGVDPVWHYCIAGWQERRDPIPNFVSSGRHDTYLDAVTEDQNPFYHYILREIEEQPEITSDSPQILTKGDDIVDEDPEFHLSFDYVVLRENIDHSFYRQRYGDKIPNGWSAARHYLELGASDSLDPVSDFCTQQYLVDYPDVRAAGVNPFVHFLTQGRLEGRVARPAQQAPAMQAPPLNDLEVHVIGVITQHIDAEYYSSQLEEELTATDCALHYFREGAAKELDPTRGFSTAFYLKNNPDISDAGVNPFYHYVMQGKSEGRLGRPAGTRLDQDSKANVYSEYRKYSGPGDNFEELDKYLVQAKKPRVKALAYYLPQFHTFPENDKWWGTGFTEWRNTARGLPRFSGHFQPRIPRDLGFYDLSNEDILDRQARLAKDAGIFGFFYYYYYFNGKRLLEKPLDILLNSKIDMPFAILWANENWTRTWDGFESEVLISQDYRDEDELDFLADIARYMRDPRYIRISGRPLFAIYRVANIPGGSETIQRWRKILEEHFELRPLIFMVQGFGDYDPGNYELDGAIEFPPHKVAADTPNINQSIDIFDEAFSGFVKSYDDMIANSTRESTPPYPLIKGVTTAWDNEARRPGRGMTFLGCSPQRYEQWLRVICDHAEENKIHGESFVVINAWNEWAEGAYLEPDTHYGAAFLNATARAVTGIVSAQRESRKHILLVGHDGYRHGAQMLLKNMGKFFSEQFGMSVTFLVTGPGPLIAEYKNYGKAIVVDSSDREAILEAVREYFNSGGRYAIVNTTPAAKILKHLKSGGLNVINLIHELPNLIKDYKLEGTALAIAEKSDLVVFPAEAVRAGFREICGEISAKTKIRPQGLYNVQVNSRSIERKAAREKLDVPPSAKLIINVGYGDLRKGFDIFADIAKRLMLSDPEYYFIWVGGATDEIRSWIERDFESRDLLGRFVVTGFVENVYDYYAAADLLFLSSREDPFPSVVLEALRAGLPVVGLVNSGGTEEIIARFGALADRNNASSIVNAINKQVKLNTRRKGLLAQERSAFVDREFRFDDYCFDLLAEFDQAIRKVSVIVPNYNYARYLDLRLNSIFRQTYPLYEIIVLDDKSTDDSVATIQQVCKEAKRSVILEVNEVNSGSVFRQWQKGVEMARGEFVWIAEADDIADENFVAKIVSSMLEGNCSLGYSDSWQIDTDGNTIGDSYKAYMAGEKPGAFNEDFSVSGKTFLKKYLSEKNVILNVSSVIWKREDLLEVLREVGSELFKYKVAGDWLLYSKLCTLNKSVSYVSTPLNGHRRHSVSVTHALNAERHYSEIVSMQEMAKKVVKLSNKELARNETYLKSVRQYLGLA